MIDNPNKFKEKIFIAGASGMAGSAIHRKLVESGYSQVNQYNILTPSSKELNLLDNNLVDHWFKKNNPSIVILAAAKVGGIKANSDNIADFLLENLKIQNNVIESAFKYGVKKFIFLGSSCIYPKMSKQPIKEDYLLSGKLEPTNEGYAIAKIAGLKLCQFLRLQYGFNAICLMPTNLYGTGDNYDQEHSHVMAALIRKFTEAVKESKQVVNCWGSGAPMREFLHCDDLGSAVLFTMENWDPASKNAPKDEEGNPLYILNIGTGKDISIKELANKIAIEVGYKGEINWDKTKPDGTPKKQLDIEKIKSLGWEPKINIEEGIKRTINEYKNKFLK